MVAVDRVTTEKIYLAVIFLDTESKDSFTRFYDLVKESFFCR